MSEDPFFSLPGNSTWNACIGKQGDELHYLDGYIEAARELADAVIEKKMFEKRDTLVLPILYNARHATELLLKYVINQMVECGAMSHGHPADHDLQGHYDLLIGSNLGDEKLREGLAALEPFIASLTRIDEDGQELRYHVNRDGEVSLKGESLANIAVIRASLNQLAAIIDTVKYRTIDFIDERHSKAFTARCSRSDLVTITGMLPPLSDWTTDAFTTAKQAVKARFELSNTQFSKAVDVIKASREMKGMLGEETDLPTLTDEEVVQMIEGWQKLHPPRDGTKEPAIVNGADFTVDELIKDIPVRQEILATLLRELGTDEVADLEALYYLGRDGYFAELFDAKVTLIKRRQITAGDREEQLRRLIDKTNLLQCLQVGAKRAGRLALAEKLKGL